MAFTRIRLNCHELQGIIDTGRRVRCPLPSQHLMNLRIQALGVAAAASLVVACGDPDSLRASLPTVMDAYTVFALSGTPAEYPSGINTFVRQAVRVDGNGNFDIAFDIDAQGNAVIYPVQRVVSSLSGARRVGIRRVAGSFESVTSAPTGTYADSAIVAAKGDVVVVEAGRNGNGDACQFDFSPFIYTKVFIEDIRVPTRSIIVQTVLNPNCGFRSFEAGIPTS